MKFNKIKLITDLIEKVIGKGPHQLHEPLFLGNEVKYIQDTIKKNFVSTSGAYVGKFEKKIEKYTKTKHAIAVINGTQAIYISLKAAGIKKDEEVLVPALTFIGTVNAISYLGAEPHFIDSSIKNFGVDCKKLEQYLKKVIKFKNKKSFNKKTGKIISAILPVHIFGHPCDIEGVIKIAKKFNLKVIEDAAEALGSFYKKKHLGTFGDAGCISFNGNKIITTGAGGAVLTNNKKIAKKIRHLVSTAKIEHKQEFIHDEIGYNFKMPSLNAALGLGQLEKIDFFLKRKKLLFKKYSETLKPIKEINIFKENINSKSNYWLQTLILENKYKHLKNKILNHFFSKKIYARPVWRLISELKPYKNKQKMNLNGAKEIYDRVINLPSSSKLITK